MCAVTGDDRSALVLTAGWSSRWMPTWKVAGREVTCPVAGMGGCVASAAQIGALSGFAHSMTGLESGLRKRGSGCSTG
jgi:hypothetical protein